MFAQKRDFLCFLVLSAGFLFTVPAWAQITASDDARTTSPGSINQDSSSGLEPQKTLEPTDRMTATPGTRFNDHNAFDPNFSEAFYYVVVHDSVSGDISMSDALSEKTSEVIANSDPAQSKLPPTLTVSTAALLDLHAMRKSAVDLCLQLPAKYRTHLSECAEIFKREIRLERLAKHHN